MGGYKYVQNLLHTGNPVYPIQMEIPWLKTALPGPMDILAHYDPTNRYLINNWGAVKYLLSSWFSTEAVYWPDVRTGGFGALFRWLLLPCVVVLFIEIARPHAFRAAAPIAALFLISLTVLAPWWPRYIIGSSIAGVLALGWVHASIRWRSIRVALSGALIVLTGWGFFVAYTKAQGPGWKEFALAVRSSPVERAALQLIGWQWPTEWALRREQELRRGDVFAHDDSLPFPAELFSHNYQTRVVFVSSAQDPSEYLRQLRDSKAKWVAVRAGTVAERALQSAGAQSLFSPPLSVSRVYRITW